MIVGGNSVTVAEDTGGVVISDCCVDALPGIGVSLALETSVGDWEIVVDGFPGTTLDVGVTTMHSC